MQTQAPAGGTKRPLPPVTVDDVCDFLASVHSGRAGNMRRAFEPLIASLSSTDNRCPMALERSSECICGCPYSATRVKRHSWQGLIRVHKYLFQLNVTPDRLGLLPGTTSVIPLNTSKMLKLSGDRKMVLVIEGPESWPPHRRLRGTRTSMGRLCSP